MKNAKRILGLIITGVFMVLAVPAMAENMTGKLTVTVTDESDRAVKGLGVELYMAADEETVLADFKDAGLSFSDIMDEKENANNSELLADYVKEENIDGIKKYTDNKGKAVFYPLDKGVYLVVCSEGEESTFEPFLCFVPTKIGNAYHYDIKSFPKVGDNSGGTVPGGPSKPVDPDDEPTAPVGPAPVTPPDTPDPVTPVPDIPAVPDTPADPAVPTIPQTGALKWPVWVLMAAGALFIALGIADMLRKDGDECE